LRWRQVLLVGVLGALVLAYVRGRVVDVVVVSGRSMEPTFADGTRLLAWQKHFKAGDVKRGEVVVLYDPTDGTLAVKRVIGLGGETVRIAGHTVYIDGEALEEPYVNEKSMGPPLWGAVKVPEDGVWVMGDNRGNSLDSRDYGPVRLSDLRGRAVAVLWPPSEWGKAQRSLR